MRPAARRPGGRRAEGCPLGHASHPAACVPRGRAAAVPASAADRGPPGGPQGEHVSRTWHVQTRTLLPSEAAAHGPRTGSTMAGGRPREPPPAPCAGRPAAPRVPSSCLIAGHCSRRLWTPHHRCRPGWGWGKQGGAEHVTPRARPPSSVDPAMPHMPPNPSPAQALGFLRGSHLHSLRKWGAPEGSQRG